MSTLDKVLMRELRLSRDEVALLLQQEQVFVNDCMATQAKLSLLYTDRIVVGRDTPVVVRQGKSLRYVLYHKSGGVECSLNPDLANSLFHVTDWNDLYPVGRLDKESEGLVLMTNDGRLYKAITTHDTIEKEYEVTVNRNISDEELQQLASGIEIMGSVTLPAIVKRCDDNKFRIILKEGRNRQIRRMCYKLKLEVEQLVRVRIYNLWLGELTSGEFRDATAEEIELLRSLYKHKFIAG